MEPTESLSSGEYRPVLYPAIDVPTCSFRYPTLFKDDANGVLRQWTIGYNSVENCVVTESGVVMTLKSESGKLILHKRPVILNQSGRSAVEQALVWMNNDYQLKRRKDGYSEDPDRRSVAVKAMLAHTYMKKTNRIKKDGTYSYSNLLKASDYPVYVSPKIDGIRCLSYAVGETVKLVSRNNVLFEHGNHLRTQIQTLLDYFEIGTILDGELYVHGWAWQRIQSAVRRQLTMSPDNPFLEYHIFDVVTTDASQDFKTRYSRLVTVFNKLCSEQPHLIANLRVVGCEAVTTHDQIVAKHEEFKKLGYEGLMIRRLDRPYEGKRTTALLKYKDFETDEAIIVDVKEENTEPRGMAILMLDYNGIKFDCRPAATVEERQHLFSSRAEIIGKKYTFKYQDLYEDGTPRFPTGIGLRDYE